MWAKCGHGSSPGWQLRGRLETVTEPRPIEQQADADRDDSEQFEGVVAFSFVLPFQVPLEPQAVPIGVDNDYFRIRGVEPAEFDHAWMQMPLRCLMIWSLAANGTNPV